MRFKVDENLPVDVAEILRLNQHDALTVLNEQLGGHSDLELVQVCIAEQPVLITLDLDFADLRHYPPECFPGIIVLRPNIQTIPTLLQLMDRVMALLGSEPLAGHLWIVDERRVRVRGSSVSGNP